MSAPATRWRARGPRRGRAHGFTLLGLMVLLAVLALASAVAVEPARMAARRQAERDLEGIGGEFAFALRAYARAAPAGAPRRPARLEDLLKDPRVPFTRRFLRRLYADPLTGRAEWGVVPAPEGGILAVYSLGGALGGQAPSPAAAASAAREAARPADRAYGDLDPG